MVLLTVLLGGFTAFGPLSMDLYLPAFPLLADDLGASQAAVQLTLTADVIGIVIGQLILGPMSDAWGRRRLLISSTLVCAVASELCALAPSVTLLIIWRFVQGLAAGARCTPSTVALALTRPRVAAIARASTIPPPPDHRRPPTPWVTQSTHNREPTAWCDRRPACYRPVDHSSLRVTAVTQFDLAR